MLNDYLEAMAEAESTTDPAETADALWDLTARFFERNGFDKIIYMDAGPGSLHMRTTLPAEWTDHYRMHDYARIDPFFTYCCATLTPISTGIAYDASHDYLTEPERRLIRDASDFGINAGFSSTIRLKGPAGVTGWNIASSLGRAEVDALRADREAELRLVALMAHDRIARAGRRADTLSARERECLALLVRGLRTKDIAQALDLSSAAIELYLRNARRKLGARTREQAVALAVSQGLIGG